MISHLLFPVPDPNKPWGGTNCDQCKEFCAGHYRRDPVFIDVLDADSVIFETLFLLMCWMQTQ